MKVLRYVFLTAYLFYAYIKVSGCKKLHSLPNIKNVCLNDDYGFCNHFIITDAFFPTIITFKATSGCEFYVDESIFNSSDITGSLKHRKRNSSSTCEVFSPLNYVIFDSVNVFDLNGTDRDYKNSYNLSGMLLTEDNHKIQFLDKNALFNVSVLLKSDVNHEDGPPYLLFGKSALLVSIECTNLSMPSQRSMLELGMTVGSSSTEQNIFHFSRSSFNDYKTPGIFRDENLNITGEEYNTSVYWKSVAYSDKSLKQISQISAKLHKMSDSNSLNHVLKMLSFSNVSTRKTILLSFDVLSPDTYFDETNFTAFYFTFGEGYRVSKHSALPLILFTGFGVGLPILSLIIFIFISWRQPSKFERLTNEPDYTSVACDECQDTDMIGVNI